MIKPADVRKTKQLARDECTCNYSGDCVIFDCDCIIQNSGISLGEGKIICKYFDDNVLPSDPQLNSLFNQDSGRFVICSVCGKPFIPTGNRQKYCSVCKDLQRKKQQAKWRRENSV